MSILIILTKEHTTYVPGEGSFIYPAGKYYIIAVVCSIMPEVCMDTIICDIAKSRLEKEFNEALQDLGLLVSSIRFDDSVGLSVILEISISEGNSFCA
jgi:hypothetical protein